MKISDLEIPDRSDAILDVLQDEEYPIEEEELLLRVQKEQKLELTGRELGEGIEKLRDRGYDIKAIESRDKTSYVLVRFAESERDEIYRPLAKIETPLFLAGDFHIGSKHFSEQAFYSMLEDIDEYNPTAIMCPGDVLQGLGVHRVELKDLAEPDIDSQISMAIDYLEEIPDDVEIHSILGNHEEKLKGKHRVGFDALKYIAKAVDNFSYYGSVAEFTLDDQYRYLMLHGKGAAAYARSYKLQKIDRNLPEPKPHIVHAGHFHELQFVSQPPNRLLVCSGTFQRESSYLVWKGQTTQVGYFVFKDYNEEGFELEQRTPSVY